jgi:poly(ADP-ribose) glycohydrolase ARH3
MAEETLSANPDDMPLKLAYRGALVGAVLGDCLGKPWEQSSWLNTFDLELIKKKIPSRVADGLKFKKPLPYTDDSAMTLALATSIVECNGFDARDVAKKFQEEYHREPWRGYGMSVTTVFDKLRFDPEDVFLPAREQFGGSGSYGNGSAMRISPVALLCTKEEDLIKVL